jgi:Ca2+/Na+ antiporter
MSSSKAEYVKMPPSLHDVSSMPRAKYLRRGTIREHMLSALAILLATTVIMSLLAWIFVVVGNLSVERAIGTAFVCVVPFVVYTHWRLYKNQMAKVTNEALTAHRKSEPTSKGYVARLHSLQPNFSIDLSLKERIKYARKESSRRDTRFPLLSFESSRSHIEKSRIILARNDSIPEIHGYDLLYPIGQGGMAITWLGEIQGREQRVLVKLWHKGFADSKEFRTTTEIAARRFAKFKNPSVAEILEIGYVEEELYLVTEYVEGISLNAFNREFGPLNELEALRWLESIARGVAAIHGANLVHRDLKPSNVLIPLGGEREYSVKITGLGLGALESGHFFYTANYAAPEQQVDGRATPASDVYTMGAILYELMGGELPLNPRALRLRTSTRMSALLSNLLKYDPNQRFQNAGVLLQAIRAYYREGVSHMIEPHRTEALVFDYYTKKIHLDDSEKVVFLLFFLRRENPDKVARELLLPSREVRIIIQRIRRRLEAIRAEGGQNLRAFEEFEEFFDE